MTPDGEFDTHANTHIYTSHTVITILALKTAHLLPLTGGVK